jgi:predicted alpha/beta superfamily hydrolase
MPVFRVLLLSVLVFLEAPAAAQLEDFAERTERVVLPSGVLGEERVFLVRLPSSYAEAPDRRYPVIYVSDADWNFELVASHFDYLAHWGRTPEVIIIGAMNVSRSRDFVPAADPNFPETGGGDLYLRHLAEEWIPMVEARYRAAPQRVLFGHSFGGVLALNQLFTEPDLFDAYIALSASVWVADRVMFDRAEAFFDSGRAMEAFLYLSVGEGDGGATAPDGALFAELLEARAPAGLDWSHTVFAGENHFTNVPVSLHHATGALFPVWGLDAELEATARQGGAAAVAAWWAQKEATLGWRFLPQSMELGLAGYRLASDGHPEAAFAVFEQLHARYPDRPELVYVWAAALSAAGRLDAAIARMEQAIALGEAVDHPRDRVEFFRQARGRLLQRREDG